MTEAWKPFPVDIRTDWEWQHPFLSMSRCVSSDGTQTQGYFVKFQKEKKMTKPSRATIKTINKHWDQDDAERLQKNYYTLNYIRETASRTQTNIKRWNIAKLFCEDDSPNLIENFNEVNRRFFAKLQAGADENDVEVSDVPEELKNQIGEFFKRSN